MKIRKLRSIICLCLVFALLSPTFTFAISDDASDVAEKTIFENVPYALQHIRNVMNRNQLCIAPP